MTQFLHIHPENPQQRLIDQAVEVIKKGGIIAYPTDTSYALGCHLDDKEALVRIRRIRQLSDKHHLTLMCRDLSEIATYAFVDNVMYRFLKAHTPGAYTFLLRATKEVPRRLQHPKRKSIGIRVPECKIVQSLLSTLNEPLMTTTLILPGQEDPLCDPSEILYALEGQVDLIIDGGAGEMSVTTMIDLFQDEPKLLRQGKGVFED